MDDLGFERHRLDRAAELECAVVAQDHVLQLEELSLAADGSAEFRDGALEHERAQGDVADEEAAGGVAEAGGGDFVCLDFADVVEEGARDDQVGVGAHGTRGLFGDGDDFVDVDEEPAEFGVVSFGGSRCALEANTKRVVREKEIDDLAERLRFHVLALLVDPVPDARAIADGGEELRDVDAVVRQDAEWRGEGELSFVTAVPGIDADVADGLHEGTACDAGGPIQSFGPERRGFERAAAVAQGQEDERIAVGFGTIGAIDDEKIGLDAVARTERREVGSRLRHGHQYSVGRDRPIWFRESLESSSCVCDARSRDSRFAFANVRVWPYLVAPDAV